MNPSPFFLSPRGRLCALTVAVALMLGGCAGTAIDANFDDARASARELFGAELQWLASEEARRQAQADVDAALAKPLSADDAVRLALAYSPAMQIALFDRAAESAEATQRARLPNPVFTFERLVRHEDGEREVEIDRMLGISVVDLLLLPSRARMADFRQQQLRLRLAGDVVQTAIDARQNWVRAVAAQQALQYFEQVKQAADASAELARRMQAVGNFSRLQRAREQAFSADAVTQLARARQDAQASREALIRSLGLDEAQAARLKLPDRLPDLPKVPRSEQAVTQQALDQRLDVRLARAELDFEARSRGLSRVSSVVNGMHIAAVRNSETGAPPQLGFELELPLPIFDAGDATRARSQAVYMAALYRTARIGVEASSQVREQYGAYRTAHDLARHHWDEVVPLRKTISEENMLRYNGMLIGVFELLADAREQIASVVQAIEAQRDFWLADAALEAALIGKPVAGVAMTPEARPTQAITGGAGH